MKKIFCFGNEYINNDEVAKELSKILDNQNNKYEFIEANSPNEILNAKEELIIIDIVKGINKVTMLTSIDDLKLSHTLTCHDLDLAFYLKLMQQTDQIKTIKIIGLPYKEKNYEYLKEEVEKILNQI